jgi:hypothetical protein
VLSHGRGGWAGSHFDTTLALVEAGQLRFDAGFFLGWMPTFAPRPHPSQPHDGQFARILAQEPAGEV